MFNKEINYKKCILAIPVKSNAPIKFRSSDSIKLTLQQKHLESKQKIKWLI